MRRARLIFTAIVLAGMTASQPLASAAPPLQALNQIIRRAVPALPTNATVTTAPDVLRNAGFEPGKFLCDSSSGTAGAVVGRVTRFRPASGTLVRVGSKVDMLAVQPHRCPLIASTISGSILANIIAMQHATPPPPPPPPPPPATQTCPDGSVILEGDDCPLPPPPPPPPSPEPERDGSEDPLPSRHGPTALPSIERPATDTGPETASNTSAADNTVARDTAPAPVASAQKGRGAFVDPGDMAVDNWHRVEFVVALTEAGLAEESEEQVLTKSRAIYVAPLMRVTLLPDPDFEIRPQSPAVQETGADRAASWQWSVKPGRGGAHELIARVEVLDKQPDGGLLVAETYTRRVPVEVKVGTWKGFLNAIKGAASFGDLLATLFKSWEKTLLGLTALIAAAVGLWAAIKKLRGTRAT